MLRIIQNIDEFAFYIARIDDRTRIMIRTSEAGAALFQSIKQARVDHIKEPPLLRYPKSATLRMKRHYALPILQEVKTSLLYNVLEQVKQECMLACSARYHDESYSISRWITSKEHPEYSTYRQIMSMVLSSESATAKPSSRVSALIEAARWKLKRKHFHCSIVIGAQNEDTIKMILNALPEGLTIKRSVDDGEWSSLQPQKPMMFSSKFCVLSDIELANIASLPETTAGLRLEYGMKKKFTTRGNDDDVDFLKNWRTRKNIQDE